MTPLSGESVESPMSWRKLRCGCYLPFFADAAAFCAAQRAFCAAAIFLRAAADMVRFFFTGPTADWGLPSSEASSLCMASIFSCRVAARRSWAEDRVMDGWSGSDAGCSKGLGVFVNQGLEPTAAQSIISQRFVVDRLEH